jgi:hypothetical protein
MIRDRSRHYSVFQIHVAAGLQAAFKASHERRDNTDHRLRPGVSVEARVGVN